MDITLIVTIIVILGLVFDYTNGFHDAANVVSTVIATRVLTPIVAIILAGILNTAGASHTSGVAQTIASGLVKPGSATEIMVICAISGAIVWNLLTWYFGIPSSSSYALIGGLIGATWYVEGKEAIIWTSLINKVLIPMFLSPVIGFFLALVLMKVLSLYCKSKKREKPFRYLQIFSASVVALSHGLNDAQKSMGIITLGLFAGGMIASPHIPFWVVISCALVMGIGTASGGFRIIHTMGFQLTKLEPIQGFAAEASASCIILTASFLGMPLSSTQMIAGSIAGVGAIHGFKAVNWSLGHKIFIAWILTLPASGFVSFLLYLIINSL
jgi:PiT family inorganic phosphate transporter